MLHYDALRQLTNEHRRHHEAEAADERLALRGHDRRALRARLPSPTTGIDRLRAARRRALQRAGHVVVTVWPRR